MIDPVVVGNWKMFKTPSETEALLSELVAPLREQVAQGGRVEVVLAPPFTSLPMAARMLSGTGVALSAQDCHWSEEGPFTGEISPRMLAEIGCRFVILGHSERREHFGETNHRVNLKAKLALFWGLTPIICVGEKRDERDSGRAEEVVRRQVQRCLDELTLDPKQRLAMAYEPVWAIGSGHTPSPQEVRSVHRVIRAELEGIYGQAKGGDLPILYGGSIKPSNIGPMMALDVVDGVLVGGASLEASSFVPIVEHARRSGPQGRGGV